MEKFRKIDGVEAVTPVLAGIFTLIDGRNVYDTSIMGILPETMEAMGLDVSTGRTLARGRLYGNCT